MMDADNKPQGELKEPEVFVFPEGLAGFPERRHFLIIPIEGGPFAVLQSVEDGDLGFVVIDPRVFRPDYNPPLPSGILENLELKPGNALYLAIVTPNPDPGQITANLQGPLVINPHTRQGVQAVLMSTEYHTRHQIHKEWQALNNAPAGKEGGESC